MDNANTLIQAKGYAQKNSDQLTKSIPPNLAQREERIFKKIKSSKLSPIKKLQGLYDLWKKYIHMPLISRPVKKVAQHAAITRSASVKLKYLL